VATIVDEKHYSAEGMKVLQGGKYVVEDSDVVCFLSSGRDSAGLHSGVKVGPKDYMWPPLTMFKVRLHVATPHYGARDLELIEYSLSERIVLSLVLQVVETQPSFELLAGKVVNRRLIIVQPTFMLSSTKEDISCVASKLATNHTFLVYGTRKDIVRGVSDITADPVLTMEMEFARNDNWKEWNGKSYSLYSLYSYTTHTIGKSYSGWKEYEYVVRGRAVYDLPSDEVDRQRDRGHEGWTIEEFHQQINMKVIEDGHKRGIEDPPLLNKNEVIGLRLYTGPAYVPINVFLREVAKVGAEWRKKLARSHKLTYAAIVGHIFSALRKLVRVNAPFTKLFRGVRGELPDAFWLEDAFGCITAIDYGFMSTSINEEVCKSFLSPTQPNVLWEIRCSAEDNVGFHSAADVSLVSQHPGNVQKHFH
jgi:hypothetical protein